MGGTLYILECSDGSYYTGTTRKRMDDRLGEHVSGYFRTCYTYNRRPVTLVFVQDFQRIEDPIACERQIKGWSRRKKQALIDGAFEDLVAFARRRSRRAKAEPRLS